MAYSPYQIAGSQASLLDLLQQSKFGKQKSRIASTSQRGKMTEEYEKELEEAQKKAEAKAKKNKGLFKGLNLLSSFLGPVAGGVIKGLTAGAQGQQQKKALGSLLDVDKKRFEKTFLRKPMKQYWEEAEDLQMTSGDVLRGALGAGISGYAMSKMLGGDEGLGKKMFKKGEGFVPTATQSNVGFTAKNVPGFDYAKGGAAPSQMFKSLGKDPLIAPPPVLSGSPIKAPDFVNTEFLKPNVGLGQDSLQSLTRKFSQPSSSNFAGMDNLRGVQADLISSPIGKMVEGAGRATPFKSLFESLQGFGKGGEGLEKLQGKMMLPMLLQLMAQGQYQ